MKGLIYRDIINLKQTFKSIFVSSIFIILVACLFHYGTLVSISIPMLLTYGIAGAFQLDAAVKWHKICFVMPIKKYQIVLSRYVEFLILFVIGMLMSLIFGYLYMEITGQGTSGLEKIVALAAFLPLFYTALFFPCVYYFKGEKMDLAVLACLIIMFVIFALGAWIIKSTTVNFQYEDLNFYIYCCLGIAIVLFLLSYFISLTIFKVRSMKD